MLAALTPTAKQNMGDKRQLIMRPVIDACMHACIFAQTPAAQAPGPAAPRTGLPGGYNIAGNNVQAIQSRAAETQAQQAAASTTPAQPKVGAMICIKRERRRQADRDSLGSGCLIGLDICLVRRLR